MERRAPTAGVGSLAVAVERSMLSSNVELHVISESLAGSSTRLRFCRFASSLLLAGANLAPETAETAMSNATLFHLTLHSMRHVGFFAGVIVGCFTIATSHSITVHCRLSHFSSRYYRHFVRDENVSTNLSSCQRTALDLYHFCSIRELTRQTFVIFAQGTTCPEHDRKVIGNQYDRITLPHHCIDCSLIVNTPHDAQNEEKAQKKFEIFRIICQIKCQKIQIFFVTLQSLPHNQKYPTKRRSSLPPAE